MYFQVIVLYFALKDIYAHFNNDFTIDYFLHKQLSSVVGYSCNLIKDDFQLIKHFSNKGLTASFSKLSNTSDVHEFASTDYWKVGIMLDTRCYTTEDIVSTYHDATNYRMFDELHHSMMKFDELHHWLILGSDLSDVISLIDDRAFGLATNFMIAISKDNETYMLYDTYNRYKYRGSMLNITFYGKWHIKYGLTVTLLQLKSARRSNFHGLLLKAIFFHLRLFHKLNLLSPTRPRNISLVDYYRYNTDLTKDGRSKFGYTILNHLGEMYNFTFECFETKNWTAGDPLGPLARSMMNFEVDVTGSPINLNIKRIYLMKFLHQVWLFRTYFIFRNPQPTTIKIEEILRPFENKISYLICITMLLFIVTLSSTFISSNATESNIVRIINSFTMTLGALCQQASVIAFPRLSARIVFICIMTFSLLVYNYYSALVVSARLEEPIYKINDSLVEFGKIRLKMASEEMVYMEYFFKTFLKVPYWETKVFYSDYWLKVSESKRFMEPEMGMRLVQKGGFAYHVHPEVGYLIMAKLYNNREICELMEVHLGQPTVTSFGVTNNSTFTDVIRVGLTKISEVGLRYRQHNRWQHKKPICRKDVLSASSINIYEFSPHLLMLTMGITVSIFIFVSERINFYWQIESTLDTYKGTKILSSRRDMV